MNAAQLLIAVALVNGPPPGRVAAQNPDSGKLDTLARGDFTLERIAGFSWFSPVGRRGDVRNRQEYVTNRRVYVAGIRGNWFRGAAGPVAVATTMEFVPLAIVERTAPSGVTCRPTSTGEKCVRDASARVAVGIGGSPIGARVYLGRTSRVRALLAGSAGILAFSSDVPTENSRQLNFTFEYGSGVEVDVRNGHAILMGYKFQHISNAGTGVFNPGLDANVVYLGLVTRRLN